MRVVHVNLARGFRGGERQTLNLIDGLAGLGVEQALLCRNGSELSRRGGALGLPIAEVAHPLLGHLRPPPADIIHVHEARGAYWAAIEHAVRNTHYIITRRIPNPISRSGVTSAVYRCADRLAGVSNDVSMRLASQTGRAVQTILSATSAFAACPERVREIRARIGGGPIVGHVGALHDHHKGQSVLIEAFHQLLPEFPQARLVLVGDGPDRQHFETLAKGDKRIVFAGFQEEVGSWIAAMDVFGFPSREEGLGSSVMDAMALGVPVVAAAVGGLPELIGANERGLLVKDHEPASWCSSIRRMLIERAQHDNQVGAARQFSLCNDIAAMSQRYMTLYEEVVHNMPA